MIAILDVYKDDHKYDGETRVKCAPYWRVVGYDRSGKVINESTRDGDLCVDDIVKSLGGWTVVRKYGPNMIRAWKDELIAYRPNWMAAKVRQSFYSALGKRPIRWEGVDWKDINFIYDL